jgi:hypothetical protein
MSLGMNPDFAARTDFVAKLTVSLHHAWIEVPVAVYLDFLHDVEAIFGTVNECRLWTCRALLHTNCPFSTIFHLGTALLLVSAASSAR